VQQTSVDAISCLFLLLVLLLLMYVVQRKLTLFRAAPYTQCNVM
jgi:hypothetical protein